MTKSKKTSKTRQKEGVAIYYVLKPNMLQKIAQ